MGQQQLLLIVLGVIIVGVAVVVGINLFNANAYNAEVDKLTMEAQTLATNIILYYRKPTSTGGGGRSVTGWDGTAWIADDSEIIKDDTNPARILYIFRTNLASYNMLYHKNNHYLSINCSHLVYKDDPIKRLQVQINYDFDSNNGRFETIVTSGN